MAEEFMADKHDADSMPVPLGLALARLPLEAPVADAWPRMSAKLQARRRRPRWPYALAASLLLAALMLPRMASSPATPSSPATAVSAVAGTAHSQLASLMAESARLERLVYAADDGGASSASAAALSIAYEDQLQALDAELAGNRDPARQLPLWQQRVELLRGIAAVETSRHYLAAQGSSFDVSLVAAY